MLELAAAFRGLRRQTGFVLVAVFTLAVGTAALAIVFTIVNAVLLRPLPYKNPNRLAVVWEKRTSEPGNWGISGADFLDWRTAASSFQSMTAQTEFFANLTGTGEPERVLAVVSSVNMLDTYGAIPLYGRAFAPDDERSGHVALLAFGLWQRRFGGDRNAIGRTLQLDGSTYSIIGVLLPGFRMLYGQGPGDIYLPLVMTPTQRQSRDSHEYLVTARLKPGAMFAQAQSELDAVNARLQREFPFTNSGHGANVMALATNVTASVRPALLMLLGAVSLLMLLACSNVASLLLARATARAREVVIRQALGASWPQIARFLLTEAMLVSVTAAAAGLIVARLAMPILAALVPRTIGPVILPGMDRLQVDWVVVLFSALVCGVTALLCGLMPIYSLAGGDSNGLLSLGRNRSSVGATRGRKLLASAEVGLACLLLIGAAALLASFDHLMRVAPGFVVAHRLTAGLAIGSSLTPEREAAFAEQLIDRLAAMPGVKSAAVSSIAPGYIGGSRTGIRLSGEPPPRSIEESKKAFFRGVSAGFMKTAGIPIARGREFAPSDSAAAQRVMIVNQELARRYFPGHDLLGKALLTPIDSRPWTVVGIVANVKQLGLDKDPYPEMYFPLPQWWGLHGEMDVIIETAGDPAAAGPRLREAVAAVDPHTPVSNVQTMETLVGQSTSPQRFQTSLVGTFACLAVLLALSGLYSVMAFLVTKRTREIGVRMALGGQPAQILRMVVAEGARLGLCGIAIGVASAFALHRVLASFLFGISATNPSVMIAAPALLLATTLLACALPAWRASRVDPATALRVD